MRSTLTVILVLGALLLVRCGKDGNGGSGLPKASFSAAGYEVPAPCTVSFFSNSENATSYNWTFGDGTTSTQASPTHLYTAIGSYYVKLKVTGPKGTDSVCEVITLDQPSDAGKSAFSWFMDRCSGTPANIYFRSINPNSRYPAWDFGEGTTSVEFSPLIRYSTPGNYTIKFSSQINGVRDTIIRAISIY